MSDELKPNNVLRFPSLDKKAEYVRDVKTIEEMTDILSQQKVTYIDRVLTHHMNYLYAKLAFDGFDTEDDKFFGDFCFVVEALKSAMMRQCGAEHPLQKFVDENFEPPSQKDDEEEDDEDDE